MPKIERLYAWVAVGEPTPKDDNNEGIMAIGKATGTGEVTWLPLVGADTERIESMREEAVAGAADAGITLRLVCFSVREDLETYDPEKS